MPAAFVSSTDSEHLARIGRAREHALADIGERIARLLRAPVGDAQGRLERDAEIHRLSARRRLLERSAGDACLGRITPADGGAALYIGRTGLSDADGEVLLVDWRSPAAAPFFAATRAHPLGLASRRRYRWQGGAAVEHWDESFTEDAVGADASYDEDSAILRSLEQARTPRMRDVLTTIAADQDAIIRADPRRPLLVEGGPGTGKTVVALHRAAYLSYTDVRLRDRSGGILVLGPHRPYLEYISDVLPGLGEEDVRTCVLADLVPEGASALADPDPEVAALKGDARMVAAIEPAVALYEEPSRTAIKLGVHGEEVRIDAADWADAFAAVQPGTPHNAARPQIWEELAEIVLGRLEESPRDAEEVRSLLERHGPLVRELERSWPLLEPADLVGDLWEVPAYLRRCAPWLGDDQAARLRRTDPRAWTESDLPLLDAARHRLGDPGHERDRARRERARARAAAEMDSLVDYLIDTDGSEMRTLSMLRGDDMAGALLDAAVPAREERRETYAHVIVDEAQELSDAQWTMVLRRCPSHSLTIVGDRAQAAAGFPGSWAERLARAGIDRLAEAGLHLNYRTPQEVMDEAGPMIRAAVPEAVVPISVRASGVPVRHGRPRDLAGVLSDWAAQHEGGTACVIGEPAPSLPEGADPRVRALTPMRAKGLEFDLVVLWEPGALGAGRAGASARYVAMTRATRELVVLGELGRAETTAGLQQQDHRRETAGRREHVIPGSSRT
ncbi:RNA polymerase recycling motor ATPase HelR [Brachybacterium hainanense]|uniref:RNA polymerase recycling motor ATPase HelR n=1 Tax=Brachybacterium hainanense TaxID=1541174 RepID=A0ABV6RE00_9MICO